MNTRLVCVLSVAAVLLAGPVGCTTVKDGTKVYDPVKTEQVKAAIKPVVASIVRRVVVKNPETAQYFVDAKNVFVSFRDGGQFKPSVIVDALNAAVTKEGWINKLDPETAGYVAEAKNLLVALYELNYADAGNADLPADKFAWNLLDILADGIATGLVDAEISQ